MNTSHPPFIMAPDGSLQSVDSSADPHRRGRGSRPSVLAGWVRTR